MIQSKNMIKIVSFSLVLLVLAAPFAFTALAAGLTASPPSIAVNVGSTSTSTISGGNGTYSIQVNPAAIATAAISGTTLTITGVATGSTSVVVQDSTASATVTVPISVNPAGTLQEQALSNTLVTNKADLLAKLTIIVNWVFTIFVILAIIFVILAAIQFLTAGGEPTKIGEARQKLIWAAVGIVVALLARGLPVVVSSILGGNITP